MTASDLATALRERMQANRQPVDRCELYAFPRGWNEAFDYIERSIKEITGGMSNAETT